MSDTDSFIEEVTEEVRRDKLYGYLRRYGWIAIAAVVAIVGGAAFTEYRRATAQTAAETYGDALYAALREDDAQTRDAALQAIATTPENAPVKALLAAASAADEGDPAQVKTALEALAADAETPAIYRDMARMRLVLLGDVVPVEDRLALIQLLSVEGQPLRIMALEQRALLHIEAGEAQAAIDLLNRIASDAEAGQGQRQRAAQLIVSLGGELDGA